MTLRFALGICVATLALGLAGLCSAQPAAVGEPIVIGERFQLRSEAMGEMRTFQVHRPPNYDISDARYPVLIVLDGDEHFLHASTTVDFLAAAGKIPPTLVVGIPNTNRFRDMVTTAGPDTSPFLTFITDELVPKIDRDYRTRPYRILAGWSDAGLFTLYSMIHAPQVLRAYISIAPAFGDNRELPKTIGDFLEEHKDPSLNADLFMTADDGTGQSLSGAWELSSYLQNRAARVRDLRFTFQRYPEGHMAVPLRSVYDGLLRIFEGWEIDDPFALYEQGGLTAIDKHYAALSARLGFAVPVPEETLIGAFVQLEGRQRFPEAEQVIKRAMESFPDSATVLYYAGRLYMRMGNNPLAVETSKKALLLDPHEGGARSLLESLKVDPNEVAPPVRVLPKDLAKFVGGYGTSAVVFEIELRGDKLFGKTSEGEYELDELSRTTFHYSSNNVYSSGGTVSFRANDRGHVTGLEFQNGGAELAKLR